MATLDEIGQEKQRISERLARIDAERTKLAPAASPQRAPQRRARGGQQAAASVSLSDATLQAVKAHPDGASANDILNHLSRELGMTVRPNHLGIALQRHRRAGRLENRDQRWYLPASAQREQSEHAAMTG